MSAGAWMMVLATALALGALAFVMFATIRTIRNERSGDRSVWREFGLGLALMVLFFVTWAGQAITEWQTFTDEQREHGESVQAGDFFAEFGQSTLENWQSEFLQLFSFVVLAALFIHKGSAESKDSDEKFEAALRRIEEQLATLPRGAPSGEGEGWKLPDTPLEAADPTSAHGRADLDSLSREDLYELARQRDIAGRSDMTRDELLRSLQRR